MNYSACLSRLSCSCMHASSRSVFRPKWGKRWHSYASLSFTEDRYGGIHVKLSNSSRLTSNFDAVLAEHMNKWKKMGSTAIWLDVPIAESALIPIAAKQGFQYHHAEGETAVLCQWIDEQNASLLPRYATHQIGVAGCVVREDTRQILMVKDRNRKHSIWKFPGGLSDLGEDIGKTAEREVFEEAGIKSKFEGILTMRQQHDHPGAFGRSDIYFICRMSPLTYEISPCAHEIEACEWMNAFEVAESANNSAITLRVLQLIIKGLQEGFDNVEMRAEEFKSIYKGRKYKLFNQPVAGSIGEYLSGVTDDSLLKTDEEKS